MSNLEMMQKRLQFQGGAAQEDRMIMDKYRTFLKTLKYSYQGCDVQLVQKHFYSLVKDEEPIDPEMTMPKQRALINPDKNKQDYDDKILSIDRVCGFEPGDVFHWINTDTYWLVYLEELTEDAYFRGEIRRCKYQIHFKDDKGNVLTTWAAIRGPVETQIDSIQKNQVRVDRPNLSLNILLPKNEQTLFAFDRYKEFLFQGRCWRVEAIDSISVRNVIEVAAEEYFIDKDTDDLDDELKDGLVVERKDPDNPPSAIQGETFIKPKICEEYRAPDVGGQWSIAPEDAPVRLCVVNGITARITWQKMVSGQFILKWSKDGSEPCEKTIVVESLL